MHLLTSSGEYDVYVDRGTKSQWDFVVKYKGPHSRRVRTPKYIHLVIDLYLKQAGNPQLTKRLLQHMLSVLDQLCPATTFPPSLQVFHPSQARQFAELSQYGEYPVEFLLVIFELVMTQEKTNYPRGVMNQRLIQRLRDDADIFSVVAAATFRGGRA